MCRKTLDPGRGFCFPQNFRAAGDTIGDMHAGIRSWKNLVAYAYNAFSIPLLLRTLFAPWKRDKASGPEYGILEKVAFAVISRILGLAARLVMIAIGLAFTLLAVATFPVFLLIPFKVNRESLVDLPTFGSSLSYGNTYTLNAHSAGICAPSGQKFFGKDKIFRMIERGLDKDTNRNILLVGDTGVGKTAVLGWLGRVGRSGLSFPGIRHHRVVALATESISSEDFDACLRQAARAGNVILVIENIHAYTALFERLLPYLDAPHLGIAVTTDFASYDAVLKAFPEFLSKFVKIDLLPPGREDTLAILANYAAMTGARIEREALAEIVRLADRFIGNQPEPAKAIAILDELRGQGRKITVGDVRQVVSDKTNIPVGDVGADEKAALIGLEASMKKKIIGQEEAIKDVAEALRRLRAGISDPGKPAGSFLFLGPTGVGKTYTAKVLAESYFGRKDAMIRFDMSEFSLPESVPVFTDRLAAVVEEMPLSLVFFDELEKANRLIHNLFLQVLDEGRLTRGSGREASFKEAIIIATSNAGAADIAADPNIDKKTLVDSLIRKNIFAPEFLNRFSGIILFRPLDKAQIRNVARLLLEEFAARLEADKHIALTVTDALVDQVAAAGFDPEFGARPINRAIEELVENKVAEAILAGREGSITL